jgi:prepilin signal peptidase PulO-like enzyme (type II secretory pathway)
MVPLVSQLFFRSRCRYCKTPYSWRYFWVELATGMLFVAVAARYAQQPWELVPNLVFVSAMIAIAFIDFEHFLIPDPLVMVALGAGVVKDLALIGQGQRPLWHEIPGTTVALPVPQSIWGALLCGWLLWQLAAVSSAAVKQEAMGGGDTFLLAAMGASLPVGLVGMAFFIAVGLGALGGVCQLAVLEWNTRGQTAALAPAVEGGEVAVLPGGDAGGGGVAVLPGGDGGGGAADPLERDAPILPWESRVGRILTVLGTWSAVLGFWWGAVRWSLHQRSIAVAGGLLALTVTVALLRTGVRLWKRGDEEWAPKADEHFEEGPGPRMIPFGPYLVVGSLIALFFGDQLVRAYMGWLGLAAGG